MPECQHEVRAYKGFEDRFKEEKFDLISIDGPFGYDMKELARIDALRILPNALAPSFTIMVDDYNRKGEQNMVKLIKGGAFGCRHCVLRREIRGREGHNGHMFEGSSIFDVALTQKKPGLSRSPCKSPHRYFSILALIPSSHSSWLRTRAHPAWWHPSPHCR